MDHSQEPFKYALEQSSHADDEVRSVGFSALVARSRKYLNARLSRSGLSDADQEDLLQEIFHRVWRARENRTFATEGSWWRWINTITRNCIIDHLRTRTGSTWLDEVDFSEIPDDEVDQVDELLEVMEQRRELYRLADEAFLDVPTELTDRELDRMVMAVKLLVLDKVPWYEVCRIMNGGSSEDRQVTRSDLDQWSSIPFIVRILAFGELHWENERLFIYVATGQDEGLTVRDGLTWDPDEVLAIQMRIQRTMLIDQISQRMSDRFTKSELSALFDRCAERFPFIEIVRRLNRDFDRQKSAEEQLSSPGLWRRLIFQYHAQNELTHRDIYDRTQPAARETGYEITMGMLNVGLSNGRLFKKLSDQLERRGNSHAC